MASRDDLDVLSGARSSLSRQMTQIGRLVLACGQAGQLDQFETERLDPVERTV